MEEWLDSDGFLHIKKNPSLEGSENGPLFTAELMLCLHILNKPQIPYPSLYKLNREGVYYTTSISTRERISHDNCTGIYVINKLENPRAIPLLPTMDWGRGWFSDIKHPRDVIFYNLMKERVLFIPLLPILLIISLISCNSPKERTSGKMLVWTRLNALMLCENIIISNFAKISFWFCEKLVNKRNGSYYEVSKIYFQEPDHPVRLLFKEMYE